MARYIDADTLYESTAEWEASALAKIEELNKTPLEEMDYAQKALWSKWTAILGERTAFKHDVADAPTADVVERKTGKWIDNNGLYQCSVCKHIWSELWWTSVCPIERMNKMMRFCPNCGAEMKGEDE